MNQEGKEQGYIYSRLWINSYLKQIDTWNVETYQERTRILTNRFLEIWKLPEIQIEQNPNAGEINIFEIEDPTGKSMQYARFFERIVKNTDSRLEYATLLTYVARKIYEIAPKEFKEKLVNEINIEKNSHNLRRPQKKGDEYYIETNLSAKDIVKRIRFILSSFNLEDELFICFKDEDNALS